MLHRFHDRFGTPGVILGVIALVLALGGTALAASKLNGTQKKEVEKIAKKFAGKPGAAGAAGTNGTNGTNGKDGAPGEKGENGAPGINGKSVTVSATAAGCPEGGATVKVEGAASGAEVCNGEVGEPGEPWPAGGTLPQNATETGTFSVNGEYAQPATVSFPIPIAQPLAAANLHFVEEGDPVPSDCENSGHPGTASANNPEAKSGNLCVYLIYAEAMEFFAWGEIGPAGGLVVFGGTPSTPETPSNPYAAASYAVTG